MFKSLLLAKILIRKLTKEKFFFILIFLGVLFLQSLHLYFSDTFKEFYLKLLNIENVENLALRSGYFFIDLFSVLILFGIVISFLSFWTDKKTLYNFLCLPLNKTHYFLGYLIAIFLCIMSVIGVFYGILAGIVFFHKYFHFNFMSIFFSTILLLLFSVFFSFLYLVLPKFLSYIFLFLIFLGSFQTESLALKFSEAPSFFKMSFFIFYIFSPRFHSLVYFSCFPDSLIYQNLKLFIILHSLCSIILYSFLTFIIFRKRISNL